MDVQVEVDAEEERTTVFVTKEEEDWFLNLDHEDDRNTERRKRSEERGQKKGRRRGDGIQIYSGTGKRCKRPAPPPLPFVLPPPAYPHPGTVMSLLVPEVEDRLLTLKGWEGWTLSPRFDRPLALITLRDTVRPSLEVLFAQARADIGRSESVEGFGLSLAALRAGLGSLMNWLRGMMVCTQGKGGASNASWYFWRRRIRGLVVGLEEAAEATTQSQWDSSASRVVRTLLERVFELIYFIVWF